MQIALEIMYMGLQRWSCSCLGLYIWNFSGRLSRGFNLELQEVELSPGQQVSIKHFSIALCISRGLNLIELQQPLLLQQVFVSRSSTSFSDVLSPEGDLRLQLDVLPPSDCGWMDPAPLQLFGRRPP